MKKLKVDLRNCYGIKELKAEFDFSQRRAFAIYAPNGAMKSSFAETFKDVADGKPSKDRVFSQRPCVRQITDENGAPIPPNAIMVIRPYEEVFGCNEKTSTLLVNQELRKQYEQLHGDLTKAKTTFLAAIKEQSGTKKDLEQEISLAFTHREKLFYDSLNRVLGEVSAQKDAPLAKILYDVIFNDQVLQVLAEKDFKVAIDDYVRRYNELLDKSTYFKRGVFNYYNASQIARILAENGFFDAKHSVNLKAEKNLEITTVGQLEKLVEKELEGIASDSQLRKKFADLKKFLEKNKAAREFQSYISNYEGVLPLLANIGAFKQDLFKSYFKARFELYKNLLEEYGRVQERNKAIEEVARNERTQWQEAIDIFNSRFFVPFQLEATNQIPVMLGAEKMLALGFTFEDGGETASLEHKDLVEVLSTGEKKALYILNIIFELEVRKKAHQETIFVVDDVADSFDYKNKYAIIQYLKDIDEEPYFHQIILTHNFDFFRTINSRSLVPYDHCLMASKTETHVELKQAAGIKNPFANDWKPNFFKSDKKKIASIPFMRNLVELMKDPTAPEYVKLTSLLHWKSDTANILEAELDGIYRNLFGGNGKRKNGKRVVIDMIRHAADDCLNATDIMVLENKIILSIAIRLMAERFMVEKIDDQALTNDIEENQTQKLLVEFRKRFSGDAALEVLERVILMTPENIHLNSFMYEPILDMSDDHLKKLYTDVRQL